MSEYKDMLDIIEACSDLSNEGNKGIVRALDESNYINRIAAKEFFKEANRELRKQKVYNAALSGSDLSEKELREIVFDIKDSELLSRVTQYHSNILELRVKELNEAGKVVSSTYEFNTDPIRVAVEAEEVEFLELGIDYMNKLVNNAVLEKIEDKIVTYLNNIFTTKADSLSEAIESLSKESKKNMTILITQEEFATNASTYKDLATKIDVILVQGLLNSLVVDLSKIAVNYIIDNISLDKDIKNGQYVAGCSIRNLDTKAIDVKAGSAF